MPYSNSQRFVQISPYLLVEYLYATAPNPEQYFVNAGVPAVGFEKIVNGYFNGSTQILNKLQDDLTTRNTRDRSVVQTGRSRFVTLDVDRLTQYLDYDANLTNTANLAISFPYNIGVYYDTIKYHFVSGYNFDDLDGVILQVQFTEKNGKKTTISQILFEKGDITTPILNPDPIYLNGAIYDRYIEIKIPSYSNMTFEFDLLNGQPLQSSTLAAKISSDGNGYVRNAPINISLYEIRETSLVNGYENYIADLRNTLSLSSFDEYNDLVAVVQENSTYDYIEYYPTWQGNFIEEFIFTENSLGNLYYVIHEIEVREQVGLGLFTTSRFTTIQETGFEAPYLFRPILQNPLATSFTINYTLRLFNKTNSNQTIRRSTMTSMNVNKYGKQNSQISIMQGVLPQKVYNKVVDSPKLTSNYSLSAGPSIIKDRKIPVFYKDTNIAVSRENIFVDVNGNLTSEAGVSDVTAIYGQGLATIAVDPFDNFYKFTVYEKKGNGNPQLLDLGNSLTYFLVFLDSGNQSVRIENIKSNISISNPNFGQIAFKCVEQNSKKILGFAGRDFYIVTKTPDGIETKLYQGKWKTQAEITASTQTGPTGTTRSQETTGTTGVTGTTTVTVTQTASQTSTPSQSTQITGSVPPARDIINIDAIPLSGSDFYTMQSGSVAAQVPKSVILGQVETTSSSATGTSQNTTTGGVTNVSKNNWDITSLAQSIAGNESLGLATEKIVDYYFKPGSPGFKLFSGITPTDFLKAALQIHPKKSNGKYDDQYLAYSSYLDFPPYDNSELEAGKSKFKKKK